LKFREEKSWKYGNSFLTVLAFVPSDRYPKALVIDGDYIAVVKSMFREFIMAVRTFFRVREIIILAELRIFFHAIFKVINDLHLITS